LQRRLFVDDDEEMEEHEHGDRVLEQGDASKQPGLAEEDRDHAVVHRVSRELVKPAHHQFPRRINRRERPASRREKIPDTPKQHASADQRQASR
jgi:hypothetical protein